MGTGRHYASIGALLTAASALATIPVLEMGINDDWSYAYIAREFAARGHFVYTGWANTMVGVQAVWASMFIRLFGFSFTLVRLSTLPFAVGCAMLLYRLARHAGLSPPFALFGTLSITLSPVFIPMSASFMTDVPGFFFWLACVACGVKAANAGGRTAACGWMAAAAAAGVAGGTVRQVVWVVPLLVLPMAAWIRKKHGREGVAGAAAVLWGASALASALCFLWFQAQPYTVPGADTGAFVPSLEVAQEEVESALQLGVACLLFLLPVLSLYFSGWRDSLRRPLALGLGLGISGAMLGALWFFGDGLLLGNIVTAHGMLSPETELLGSKPEILPAAVRALLGVAMLGGAGVTAVALFQRVGGGGKTLPSPRLFALLYAPAALIYTLAILYRAVNDWILLDRYVIPLLPMAAIPLLWHYQQRMRRTPPVWSWMVLGLFGFYGVATTHDYMAAARARLAAASAVTAAGVPRTQVTAGLEYDAWTELEQSGHVNDEGIRNPPGAYRPQEGRRYPVSPPYWFWEETPGVEPRYLVVYSRLPALGDAPFPTARYQTWLPPFHREVFTQMAPAEKR
ncbi:MAG: glycosyltransferase family 39 protein [Acidobacteriia bacterium]|nr:glycosyltransferase family 39 protein [Terriglobia bacterium]